jgi:aldehyde:ferredoxin oxidoreductase
MYGFAGATLRVNLSTGAISRTPTDELFARRWMGGRGFIARILYDEVPRDADPLGPDNLFVMAPGVLTGSFAPAGSKVGFGCISPATNGYADSSMGGHLGPELKYAGYDLVVLEEISPRPVILVIDDDRVELRDAGSHWGRGALELEIALKCELGDDFQIAAVGPAAENGIVFSCISHDHGRQAGRCGTGAVLGSKRVKAIAVRGTGSLAVADLAGQAKQTKEIIERTSRHPNMEPWQRYGTSFFVDWANERGCFPHRNYQTSHDPDASKINGERLVEDCLVSHKACYGCWMNCGKYSRARLPGKPEVYVEGPEYETTALLGGNCAISDIHAVAYLNHLCDDLGVDTISAGGVAGFAMECYERGIITRDDLGGRELRFGNVDDLEHLLRMICRREGIGDVLARGTKGAAEILARGSIDFASQAKGLEFSGYDPRGHASQLLAFCTSDVGAHHNRCWSITADEKLGRDTTAGKADAVIYLQHLRPLFDTWGCCRLFWGELEVTPEEHVRALELATGWKLDLEECLLVSERVWNLNRAHFLERNGGPGRRHDRAPRRHLEEAVPSGPNEGRRIGAAVFDALLDDYYHGRGWDRDGNPTREILEALDLGDAADNLERRSLLGAPLRGGIPDTRGMPIQPDAM